MKYSHLSKNQLSSIRTKKINRDKFIRNCLRGSSKPISIEDAKALSPINMKVFKENASSLFPLVLDLIGKGWSYPQIERELGIANHLIPAMLQNYDKLAAMVKEVKKIKTDDVLVSELDND